MRKTEMENYRTRMSVAWDYDGCMYYQEPFRKKFPKSQWNTYYASSG